MGGLRFLFPEIMNTRAQLDDSGFIFANTVKKTITPLNMLSLAFGGQYSGYPPYGDKAEVEVDFIELMWVPYIEYEEEQMERRKMG